MGGFVSLTLDLPEADAERAAARLWELGVSGLEVRDNEAPPMPGVRGPKTGEAILVAFFADPSDADAARAVLVEEHPDARVHAVAIPEADWSTAWRARIRSNRVGRVWVGPPWDVPPSDAVALHVEPKMAFGTGDHPTTALCLEAVDAYLAGHPGASVLDVGTGTGVLALAARKLGAARVVGLDNDPVSVGLARENASVNGVEGVAFSEQTLDQVDGPFDLVVANILAHTLVMLAPGLVAHTGDRLVLAGVLSAQAREVSGAFTGRGLRPLDTAQSGDWVRLSFSRG